MLIKSTEYIVIQVYICKNQNPVTVCTWYSSYRSCTRITLNEI